MSHYAFLGTGRKRVSGNLSPNYKYINGKTVAMANFEYRLDILSLLQQSVTYSSLLSCWNTEYVMQLDSECWLKR